VHSKRVAEMSQSDAGVSGEESQERLRQPNTFDDWKRGELCSRKKERRDGAKGVRHHPGGSDDVRRPTRPKPCAIRRGVRSFEFSREGAKGKKDLASVSSVEVQNASRKKDRTKERGKGFFCSGMRWYFRGRVSFQARVGGDRKPRRPDETQKAKS